MRDEKGKESFTPMANEGQKGKRGFHARWDAWDAAIWDLKKLKLYIFDVYLNILHLSYKTYAENTIFIPLV